MIQEVKGNLFHHTDDVFIAHCISGDIAFGAGVAKEINSRYNTKLKIQRKFGDTVEPGKTVLVDNIFNLVDKQGCRDKADIAYLTDALIDMKNQCDIYGIKHIIMPRIGCGRDRLNWMDVKNNIDYIFGNSDIDITIYVR